MKKSYLISGVVIAGIIVVLSCHRAAVKSKLIGKWHSADHQTKLQITAKEFILDEGEPIAENYFAKGDTLFTSYEGSEPYTEFIVKNVSDKSMVLVYPDSTAVQFFR